MLQPKVLIWSSTEHYCFTVILSHSSHSEGCIWPEWYIFSPYRAVNTIRLNYKNQPVNAKHINTLCGQNVELLHVQPGSTTQLMSRFKRLKRQVPLQTNVLTNSCCIGKLDVCHEWCFRNPCTNLCLYKACKSLVTLQVLLTIAGISYIM